MATGDGAIPGQTVQPVPPPVNPGLNTDVQLANPSDPYAQQQAQFGNFQNSGQLENGVEYSHDLSSDVGTQVQGDRARAQILLNQSVTGTEGDINQRNQARGLLTQQMNNFGANQTAGQGQFNAQQDQALNNSLSMARRQMGGTGTAGSQQAGANLGSIVGANEQARASGLLNLQNQGVQQLNTMANTEGQTLNQSLAERGFTLNQGETLANQLDQQANAAYGNYASTLQPQGPSFASQIGGSLLNAGTTLGAAGIMAPK